MSKNVHLSVIRSKLAPTFNLLAKAINQLFTRTFSEPYPKIRIHEHIHALLLKAMDAQIEYLNEVIALILSKKDPLSVLYANRNGKQQANPIAFQNTRRYIIREIEKFIADRRDLYKDLQKSLSKIEELENLEARMGFWLLIFFGMEVTRLVNITKFRKKITTPEILCKIAHPLLVQFSFAQRLLGINILFAFYFYQELEFFLFEQNRVDLVLINRGKGYQVSTWLKHRYKTGRQDMVKYTYYLEYFFDSFCVFKGYQSKHIRKSMNDIFCNAIKKLNDELNKFDNYIYEPENSTANSKIKGLINEYYHYIESSTRDEAGIIIDRVANITSSINFLIWIDTLLERVKLAKDINVYHQVWLKSKLYKLNYKTFNFILPATKSINEFNDRIFEPWY